MTEIFIDATENATLHIWDSSDIQFVREQKVRGGEWKGYKEYQVGNVKIRLWEKEVRSEKETEVGSSDIKEAD
jgi:hypothetical protein